MTFATTLSKLSDAATQGEWKICEHSWSDTSIVGVGDHKVCLLSIAEIVAEDTQDADEALMAANANLITLLANRRREILALVESVDAAMRWQDENCEDAELFKEWLALTESMKSALANLDRA